MANVFISYAKPDEAAAKRIEQFLLEKGHRIKVPVGAAVVGNWRTAFIRGLVASDVLVVLISDAAMASKNVVGEIGAARAMYETRGMLTLPVLLNGISYPDYVSDLYCFKLIANTDEEAAKTAHDLDNAISDSAKLAPRIFISHRHIDKSVAAALVALLEQGFNIRNNDLRCTSVKPYMLDPGERTSEKLRSDLSHAELVIGILSPDTVESNYVLCELGASWGRDVPTFPVLARGATIANVPSPLNERNPMTLEEESNCLDLIEYVATKTSLQRVPVSPGTPGRLSEYAKRLVDAARMNRS